MPGLPTKISSLFAELKRRNVFRVGIAYLIGAWVLLQIIDVIGPILHLPETIAQYLLFLLVIGLFPIIVLAWVFELTPEGVKLESEVGRSRSTTAQTGRKLDRAIIGVLVVAIGILLFDKLVMQSRPGPDPAGASDSNSTAQTGTPVIPAESSIHSEAGETRGPIGTSRQAKSVAVLPFIAMSNGPDDDYFTDGLTEEIINALAQLPELLVTARTSAFHFKGKNQPVGDIASQLGVQHIVEGSVRRAGEQLRITAQLVRAADGFHLWSETYDRHTEDTLAIQADIAEKVASALNVILDEDQRARMLQVGVRNVEAYTAYQKGYELFERAHAGDNLISLLRQANQYFETATRLVPGFADAYLRHSDLYSHILMIHAGGQLDGNVTDEDVAHAPGAIRYDFDRVLQNAGAGGLHVTAEFDRALLLGDWRGLTMLVDRALAASGCRTAMWPDFTAAFGKGEELRGAFARSIVCDPLLMSPRMGLALTDLWLGQPQMTIRLAESEAGKAGHKWLTLAYIKALFMEGRTADAERATNNRRHTESEMLISKAVLAALQGDAAAASAYQDQYLGKYGSDDLDSLLLEAVRGQRNEANRLAGLIDRRPFGHLVLLQAIYRCTCGAPFDLEATPVFAEMLAGSGLPWPPAKPIDFPLKDW
jgi:adenylate cyclase